MDRYPLRAIGRYALSVEVAVTAVTANEPICLMLWMIRDLRIRSAYGPQLTCPVALGLVGTRRVAR
jgi:hypothetical protein